MFQTHVNSARRFGSGTAFTAKGLLDWLLRLDARHRELEALARLDDTMLRDIGVTRAEVDAALGRPSEPAQIPTSHGWY